MHPIRTRFTQRTTRILPLATAIAVFVSTAASTTCLAADQEVAQYHVTLEDLTTYQGFSFPVAATHRKNVQLVKTGQPASVQAAAIAQNGNPVPMYNLLTSTDGVTDVVVYPFPVSAAGNPNAFWMSGLPYFNGSTLVPTVGDHNLSDVVAFDIWAERGDVFSIAAMLMCTNDGLAILNGVSLPSKAEHIKKYQLQAYDAGVEINDFYTPDVVDPCALMAPYSLGGGNGVPQLSTSDGNINSPPSGMDSSIATNDPVLPLNGRIPDNSESPDPGSYVPATWGWSGPVGRVVIERVD